MADRQYFGLDAKTFHDGAERTLARISAPAPEPPRIDVHSLGQDFRLDAAASWTLLRALLASGLLLSDGPGAYRPAPRFQEYARADLVVPLSRASAREILETVRQLAERINANWARNRYLIRMVLISGSYMSRSRRVPELSLWLVLRRRHDGRTHRWNAPLGKGDSARQIVATVNALSPLIVVRAVADRQAVPRPFSVVFDADEGYGEPSGSSWERFRGWGASISRRLSLK